MSVQPSPAVGALTDAAAWGRPVTALLGRAVELQMLRRLLEPGGPTLINVTGARGMGKTRLVQGALDVAPTGFADIARLDLTGETVTSALAGLGHRLAAMPIAPRRGDRPYGAGRTLLHLDRADFLSRSGRELVELFAERGRAVVVLESVRQVRAPGIGVVHVGPLDPAAAEDLFRRTAESVGVRLGTDIVGAECIRRICAAVDANPLAIELAAVRLPSMSLAALATVLETPGRALAVLSRPATEATGSARAVQADLRESHEATSPAAHQLLDLLSVFDGSFGLGAVEAVREGALTNCYDALDELLDLRLVELDPVVGESRYRLSRLVRGYASERLAVSGLQSTVLARRAGYYADLARRAAVAFDNVEEGRAGRIVGGDFAEALAALSWLRGVDPAGALRLAADLGCQADLNGGGLGLRELLMDLTRTDLPGAEAPRRDALLWLAQMGSWSSLGADLSDFIGRQLAEGVDLARRLAEPLPLLRALRTQFATAVALGDIGSAMASCVEGIQLASGIGHVRWLGRFEIAMGATYAVLRQYDEAARVGASGLARAIRSGDQEGVALGSLSLHVMPAAQVANRAELPPLEGVLAIFGNQGDVAYQLHTLATLAQEAIDANDLQAAAGWALQRLEHVGTADLLHGLTVCVMLGVHISRLGGDHAISARLHGSVSSHVDPLLAVMAPVHVTLYRDGLDTLRAALGREQYDAQVARGRLLDREQTLLDLTGYLRGITAGRPEVAEPAPYAAADGRRVALTARERQVLDLLARGRRNKEIAVELKVTSKSVMHHTVAIYRKLGVRSRTEAVTTAARSGLLSIS